MEKLTNVSFDDVIMRVMCWHFLSFLEIDVFLLVTNGIQQEIVHFLCKQLFNSQQQKFFVAIINVNFHTFKICQESADSQVLYVFVFRCYKLVLFTLLTRSRCFEIVQNVAIQFRGDSERYRSENVIKTPTNSVLSFDDVLNDISDWLAEENGENN